MNNEAPPSSSSDASESTAALAQPVEKTKLSKKERKLLAIPKQTNLEECSCYISKKHRFCKYKRAPNSEYCFTHLSNSSEEKQNDGEEDKNGNNKRVRCPVDPSHTVYESRLSKHIKICNKSVSQNKMVSQPYYSKNLNYDFLKNMEGKSSSPAKELPEFTSLGDLFKKEPEYFKNLISKISSIYEKLDVPSFISDSIKENFSFSNTDEEFQEKHHKQHCSFLCNMDENKCLSEDVDYVEFGCGKGSLSYFVRRALMDIRKKSNPVQEDQTTETTTESSQENVSDQTFVLIDRANQRRKVDNFIKHGTILHNNRNNTKTQMVNVERIMIDIGDLDLSKSEAVQKHAERKMVSISKHLCGVATDLTLACLENFNTQLPNKNDAVFIALCCHHKCSWEHYVNRPFLLENGINEVDFRVMILLTSFATCQFTKLTNKQSCEDYGLTDEEKETIGFKAKRILDLGRLLYLKSKSQYKTIKLAYYCQKEASLENCMLICHN